MALHNTGLGKGLDALIRETQEPQQSSGVRMLPLGDIVPNPRQPRRNFNEKALEELAASIRSQGLLQPLLVRPLGPPHPGKFEIVAGERRWRASQIAGLSEVPVLVRSFSALDTLAAALIENLQREDLNPIEEAQGLHTLKEEFGLSQDDLAQKLGKSRSAIANSLRLLSLSEPIRGLIADGKLSAGHARALLSVTDSRAQEYLKNLILESRLSVREAEGLASGWKDTGRFELAGLSIEPQDGGMEIQSTPEMETESESDSHENAPQESGRDNARKSKPQSAKILEIQNRIGEIFHVPVRVTGKETKGKISFSFNSKEELDALLERLASNVLEGENRSVLQGRQSDALTGSMNAKLTGSDFDELSGHNRAALHGATMEKLKTAGYEALDGYKAAALTHSSQQALNAAPPEVLSTLPVQDLANEKIGEAFIETAVDQTNPPIQASQNADHGDSQSQPVLRNMEKKPDDNGQDPAAGLSEEEGAGANVIDAESPNAGNDGVVESFSDDSKDGLANEPEPGHESNKVHSSGDQELSPGDPAEQDEEVQAPK